MNYVYNSLYKSQASVRRPFGMRGRRNIHIGMYVIGQKIFCSKAWRRIIPFGLSAKSATKEGCRIIPFGMSIVRRKSQPSTLPSTGISGKGDVTRHETIRRITNRKLKNE